MSGNISIRVSSVGLENKSVYVAHDKGNWGPELEGSDHQKHPLTLSDDGLFLSCDGDFLEDHEEFKIVVPVTYEAEAKQIYSKRMAKRVHVNIRFDFDSNHNTLWLLAESHPVVRPGEWNQNNVYS